MWDYIRTHPWVWQTALVVAILIVAGLNAAAIAAFLWTIISMLIQYVALPALVLFLIVRGLAKIAGHGTLWGKKKSDK
jgi:hypothetical protein